MTSRPRRLAVACLACIVSTLGPAGTAAAAKPISSGAVITVQVDRDLGPVNPLVFGHNVEAAPTIWGTTTSRTGDGLWDPVARAPVAETVAVARDVGMGMLRYPGGCLVHSFDWKNAVGPVAERPEHSFGLDEFLTYCRTVGAKPLITVSAFVGGPAEAAELVEYLNAPATPDHPWASLRAELGHPEPWDVRFFEMGNESDHGNHDLDPPVQLSARQYTHWFNQCSAAMRAVDPDIQLGALMGTGTGPFDAWNRIVLEGTRGTADFISVHTYAVGYWGDQPEVPADRLMRACMATADQAETLLARYNAEILRHRGRAAPLAITEYNAAFVQEEPIPYRFSLGAALFAADYVRVLLQPEHNVLMANYWHFVNGYWGLLQGPRTPDEEQEARPETPSRLQNANETRSASPEVLEVVGLRLRPPDAASRISSRFSLREGLPARPLEWTEMAACPLFRLWGSHFGSRLVAVQVQAPRLEFEGLFDLARAAEPPLHGAPARFTWQPEEHRSGPGWEWTVTGDDAMTLVVSNVSGEHYAAWATLEAEPLRRYTLSCEARLTGTVPADALIGLALVDGRGYDTTGCGARANGIEEARQWQVVRTSLNTLEDTSSLAALWSLSCGEDPVDAVIEVRHLSLELEPTYPGYPVLTAAASLAGEGDALFLVVFNKHHELDVDAEVKVEGARLVSGRHWVVTGPSLEATNLDEQVVRETVSAEALPDLSPGGFHHTFPARSMTAFELVRQRFRQPSGRTRPVVN